MFEPRFPIFAVRNPHMSAGGVLDVRRAAYTIPFFEHDQWREGAEEENGDVKNIREQHMSLQTNWWIHGFGWSARESKTAKEREREKQSNKFTTLSCKCAYRNHGKVNPANTKATTSIARCTVWSSFTLLHSNWSFHKCAMCGSSLPDFSGKYRCDATSACARA